MHPELAIGDDPTRFLASTLSAELIDGIAEAVAWCPDRYARSLVIGELMREIYETIAWLGGSQSDKHELANLRRLLTEADAHQHQMAPSSLRDRPQVCGDNVETLTAHPCDQFDWSIDSPASHTQARVSTQGARTCSASGGPIPDRADRPATAGSRR